MSREQEKLCQPYHTPLYPLEVGFFVFFFHCIEYGICGVGFSGRAGSSGARSTEQPAVKTFPAMLSSLEKMGSICVTRLCGVRLWHQQGKH